jgi:5-formyltetrahydrofolate cyclo-ligase
VGNQDVRRVLLEQRQALPPEARTAHAKAVCQHVVQMGVLEHHTRIGAYVSVRGELDPLPMVQTIWQRHVPVFMPIVLDPPMLQFARCYPDTPQVPNRFGINEPTTARESAESLDIIFMPLVGFDRRGNRIGMGAGFYDRALAFVSYSKHAPQLIGLAHACQEVAHIVPDVWDIPLDYVVTEEEVIKVNTSATT